MKTCLIRQPAGLGDIFFSQKIAKEILREKKADQVIWPVIKEYSYLSEYLLGEGISYIDENESFPFQEIYFSDPHFIINNDELLYLPIQRAPAINCPIMQAKYKLVNISYDDWKNFFKFKRNLERETYLEKYLGITDEPFNLINDNFGSKNSNRDNKISFEDVKNGYKSIRMDYNDFDNVFDWTGLMKKAAEVHTVDTAWCYLLEKIGKQKVTVYAREKNESFFCYVRDIFNPKWTYIL